MKKALIISISMNILIVGIFAGKRIYYRQPQMQSSSTSCLDQWNEMRVSLFNMHAVDSNDIVFVGDSHTEAFPVTELFGSHAKNRGIGGNKTVNILQRIPTIARYHPRKIFIECGVNDFINGNSADSAFVNYTAIIDSIKKESPNTLVYVQSTIPTRGYYNTANSSIAALNTRLSNYCKNKGVVYIDLCSKITHDGQLDGSLTSDGIHLNGKGYEIWQREIEGYLH